MNTPPVYSQLAAFRRSIAGPTTYRLEPVHGHATLETERILFAQISAVLEPNTTSYRDLHNRCLLLHRTQTAEHRTEDFLSALQRIKALLLDEVESYETWFKLHKLIYPDGEWREVPERFVEPAEFTPVEFDLRPYELGLWMAQQGLAEE